MERVGVYSEIGHLEGVIIHTPGPEIEQMVPENIHEALYSDLLNLKTAQKEHNLFAGVLSKWTKTYQVRELLAQLLTDESAKEELLRKILGSVKKEFLLDELMSVDATRLSHLLIEGYPYQADKHPAVYADKKYILAPLYNLFFTRDASSTMYDKVVIHSMSTPVRDPESYVMEAIFKHLSHTELVLPRSFSGAHTEGGDLLIAKEDVLFVGNGSRTNKQGIAFLVDHFVQKKSKQHIVVQELPETPDSFIHLDMVFTMLAQDKCMVYEPLIMNRGTQYATTHIEIDNGVVHYHTRECFYDATRALGFDMEPVLCGGDDLWQQQREQWHSGANFFALGEGKIMGYERNSHTIEALSRAGFDVIRAEDICSGSVQLSDYKRFVVVVDSTELPRGGGGARCMTMPILRRSVQW